MNNNYRFLIDNYLYNLNSEESSRIRSFIKENFGPKRKAGFDYVGKSNVFIGNYLRLFWLYEQKEYDMVLSESVEYFYEMSKKTGTLWEHDQAKASCNHGFASVIAVLLLRALVYKEG